MKSLSQDRRIDPKRIAILGWANGGSAILTAAIDELRTIYAGPDLRFAAIVPIQAWCGVAVVGKSDPHTPILILHGGKDDFLPPQACQSVGGDARAAGAEVNIVIYPEAAHNWDGPVAMRFIPNWPSVKDCLMVTDLRTMTVRMGNGVTASAEERSALMQMSDYMHSCISQGQTEGRVESVRAKALADVKAFLKKSFDAAG